jgi:hypothetical protein
MFERTVGYRLFLLFLPSVFLLSSGLASLARRAPLVVSPLGRQWKKLNFLLKYSFSGTDLLLLLPDSKPRNIFSSGNCHSLCRGKRESRGGVGLS